MKKYIVSLMLLLFSPQSIADLVESVFIVTAPEKIIKEISITTNIDNFYPTTDDLIVIEDEYKLIQFFVMFTRPIVADDNLLFKWKHDGETIAEIQIETKKNIWWYGVTPTLGKWQAVIEQNNKVLAIKTFFYVNRLTEDEVILQYTFKELLRVRANQNCAETFNRLRRPTEYTRYYDFLRVWWRKKCLVNNQYAE
ncbi:MAG: hypothetical protein ACREAU_00945 [Nitrosopumilaceae archaeon]